MILLSSSEILVRLLYSFHILFIIFGLTMVMCTAKTIPFLENTGFIIVFIFWENQGLYILVLHVIRILKLLLVNLRSFFKKFFKLLPLSSHKCISRDMKSFYNFKQSRGNYKTFISILYPFLN